MEILKVARWGNSLAVRLPVKTVCDLALKEGDFVEADLLGLRKAPKAMTREDAVAGLKATRWPLPEGYKFDRDDANAR